LRAGLATTRTSLPPPSSALRPSRPFTSCFSPAPLTEPASEFDATLRERVRPAMWAPLVAQVRRREQQGLQRRRRVTARARRAPARSQNGCPYCPHGTQSPAPVGWGRRAAAASRRAHTAVSTRRSRSRRTHRRGRCTPVVRPRGRAARSTPTCPAFSAACLSETQLVPDRVAPAALLQRDAGVRAPNSSDRPGTIEPLSPSRYKVQFTASASVGQCGQHLGEVAVHPSVRP